MYLDNAGDRGTTTYDKQIVGASQPEVDETGRTTLQRSQLARRPPACPGPGASHVTESGTCAQTTHRWCRRQARSHLSPASTRRAWFTVEAKESRIDLPGIMVRSHHSDNDQFIGIADGKYHPVFGLARVDNVLRQLPSKFFLQCSSSLQPTWLPCWSRTGTRVDPGQKDVNSTLGRPGCLRAYKPPAHRQSEKGAAFVHHPCCHSFRTTPLVLGPYRARFPSCPLSQA